MRQSYTPIFHSTVNSRVWALSPAARCVWLWLHLSADPEGFVCATVAGVAVGANVDVGDARRALEGFEQADPDALPDDAHGGRVIERVPRGWRVLGFEEIREMARYQARKARQRRYMKAARDAKPVNDVSPPGSPGPTVSPTKTRSKTKPVVSEDNNPPTPQGQVDVPSVLRVVHQFPDGWEPSDELRQEALAVGVLQFDRWFKSLRTGPIGGARGIFEHKLESYVRGLFGTWRTWEETERARAGAAKKTGTGGVRVSLEPTAKHRAYAKKHNLPLDGLVGELLLSGAVEDLGAKRALEMLGEKMSRIVRERQEGAAA